MAFALAPSLQLRIRNTLKVVLVTEDDFIDTLLAIDIEADDIPGDSLSSRILTALKVTHGQSHLLDWIAEVRKLAPDDPDLAQVETDLKARAAPSGAGGDPFQACRLTAGHVLVNRAQLRQSLGELYSPIGKRILVVKDDPALAGAGGARIKSGKSHSLQLVVHLAQATQGFRPVVVDLEEVGRAVGSGKVIEPDDLAKQITALMGCKHIVGQRPADGQWARWTLEFCNDFEKAVKDAEPTWIVIDQFHLVLLPQQTADLVKDLAKRVGTTLTNLRLVLLGYTGSFHPSTLPEEELLQRIGEGELMDFFWQALKEKNIQPTADRVAANVDAVLEALDPSQPDYHQRLGALVIAELRKP
jgi:hypothetical protein